MNDWNPRIFNEEDPADLNTLYGQLSRIATNRAVYLSIKRMTEENKVPLNELIANFISDGYNADLVLSVRRLVESNKDNKGKQKKPDKSVNSIMGLVEALNNAELISEVKSISTSIGDAPNKIFGHNDFMFHSGEKVLNIETYNTFDAAIKRLFNILSKASLSQGIYLPDKLVATNQDDWALAFDKPWRGKSFDDSDIWHEL